jgi:hypothetical protein
MQYGVYQSESYDTGDPQFWHQVLGVFDPVDATG